jgi:Fur family ferric uptake transcriptional regulator
VLASVLVPANQRDVERFRDFLTGKGLKLTAQRAAILERALRSEKHFSADDLVGDLRARGISKATVYRTLALLVAADVLEAVDLLDKGYKLYEKAGGHEHHHDHLICIRCRAIVEFHDERIEAAQADVARANGFQIHHHTHKIYGICTTCAGRNRNGRS